MMLSMGDLRTGLFCTGLLLMIVAAACTIQVLPAQLAHVLIFWAVLSLPLGIAVGHCTLNDD